jgi:uncharacterized protein
VRPASGVPVRRAGRRIGAAATRASRATQLIHSHQTLGLRTDGALRIVVVADTHSAPHPQAAVHIAAQRPDHILHAGDIGDLVVLDRLARLAPLTAIRGNIDTRAAGLPDAITIDVRDGDETILTLLLLHIAVYGPKLRADAARLARSERASVVVCGHSHVPFLGRDKGLLIVNPGSIGPRRFDLPIVFAVVDISRARLSMHHVNCETGERWEPGRSSAA